MRADRQCTRCPFVCSSQAHFIAHKWPTHALRLTQALYEKRGSNLSTTDGLYVGIKLLGLYFLCIAVKDIPSALGTIGLSSAGETEGSVGALGLYLLSTLIVLFIGLLLAFKTNWLHGILSDKNDNPVLENPISMAGAMKLIGVYLVVTSVASIISNVGVSLSDESSLLVKTSLYGPSLLTCILGMLLAIKGQFIWSLISE